LSGSSPRGLLELCETTVAGQDEVTAGTLHCTDRDSAYPMREAIYRGSCRQKLRRSFGFQWNAHRRTQLDSYAGLPISRERLVMSTQWPQLVEGVNWASCSRRPTRTRCSAPWRAR